jgi:hypothetical protein
MTRKRSIDSPADTKLAREIESLTAVDPSPELIVRIRSHIAGEPSLLDARRLNPRKGWWNILLPGPLRTPANLGMLSRQLALATVILAVLAAPLVYHAVRDRQRYTYVDADDQLLLDRIGANVSRAIPQILEPLLQPLSSDKSDADGTDDTGRPR